MIHSEPEGFHDLWGQCKDGIYDKKLWNTFQQKLVEQAKCIAELQAENAYLLVELMEAYGYLRGGVSVLRDYPADTILGDSGVDAINQLSKAEGALGCTLANYPDPVRADAKAIVSYQRVVNRSRLTYKYNQLQRRIYNDTIQDC